MKYTKGPWIIDDTLHDEDPVTVIEQRGRTIAEVVEWAEGGNACLIAAAPDLLEACEKSLKVFHLDSDMEEDFAPEIKALEQAITKARRG